MPAAAPVTLLLHWTLTAEQQCHPGDDCGPSATDQDLHLHLGPEGGRGGAIYGVRWAGVGVEKGRGSNTWRQLGGGVGCRGEGLGRGQVGNTWCLFGWRGVGAIMHGVGGKGQGRAGWAQHTASAPRAWGGGGTQWI